MPSVAMEEADEDAEDILPAGEGKGDEDSEE